MTPCVAFAVLRDSTAMANAAHNNPGIIGDILLMAAGDQDAAQQKIGEYQRASQMQQLAELERQVEEQRAVALVQEKLEEELQVARVAQKARSKAAEKQRRKEAQTARQLSHLMNGISDVADGCVKSAGVVADAAGRRASRESEQEARRQTAEFARSKQQEAAECKAAAKVAKKASDSFELRQTAELRKENEIFDKAKAKEEVRVEKAQRQAKEKLQLLQDERDALKVSNNHNQ